MKFKIAMLGNRLMVIHDLYQYISLWEVNNPKAKLGEHQLKRLIERRPMTLTRMQQFNEIWESQGKNMMSIEI